MDNRFIITPLAAHNLLKNQTPIPGLAYLFAEGQTRFGFDLKADPDKQEYFDIASYENWLLSAIEKKKSVDDVASFLAFFLVISTGWNMSGESDYFKMMVYYRLSLLGLDVFNAYAPHDDSDFALTPDELAEKALNCNADIIRYLANKALPFSSEEYTEDEYEFLFRLFCSKKKLTEKEKDDFKVVTAYLSNSSKTYVQTVLGNIYERNDSYEKFGIAPSYKKALDCYLKAGKSGEHLGYLNAGRLYLNNLATPGLLPDYEKAFKCLVYAAIHHENAAYCYLSDMYKNGLYVEKDEKQALYLLTSHFSEVFYNSYDNDDHSTIGLYYVRLSDFIYKKDDRQKEAVSLSYLLLAKAYYQWICSYSGKTEDQNILNTIVNRINDLSEEMQIRQEVFELPYHLSDDEISTLFNSYSFVEMTEKCEAYGKKGDTRIIMSFYLRPDKDFIIPLVSSLTNITFSNIKLAFELDKPLKSDLKPITFAKGQISETFFFSHLYVVLGEDRYTGTGITILSLSYGVSPLLDIGEEVILTRKHKNAQKGSVGRIESYDCRNNKFMVRISDSEEVKFLSVSPTSLKKKR